MDVNDAASLHHVGGHPLRMPEHELVTPAAPSQYLDFGGVSLSKQYSDVGSDGDDIATHSDLSTSSIQTNRGVGSIDERRGV